MPIRGMNGLLTFGITIPKKLRDVHMPNDIKT
ncbi:MAG: hypothetical protein ACJAZK_002248 [Psychroserpens sp.]|jgi:hypothetical protein